MSADQPSPFPGFRRDDTILDAEVVEPQPLVQPPQPRKRVPIILFLATCVTTYLAGGPAFSLALMFTLLAHEFGHYLQARRYGVPASLPFFIPMPLNPIGTMGAVILMAPGMGNRRTLFDIAITGPLAGLLPALVFCVIGLQWSEVVTVANSEVGLSLGEPLLFKLLVYLSFGPVAEGQSVILHPVAYAGWVGIFITALNLFPVSQLDGGHILYALLLRRSHAVAKGVLIASAAAVIIFGYLGWILMLLLLFWIGAEHPPTANDYVPLGPVRTVLGWTSLLFVPLGFTPMPFYMAT